MTRKMIIETVLVTVRTGNTWMSCGCSDGIFNADLLRSWGIPINTRYLYIGMHLASSRYPINKGSWVHDNRVVAIVSEQLLNQ